MHSATSRPSSRPPPLSLSPPASTRRSVRSLPKPASGSGPSIATSRPARTSSWPSTGTRSKPSPKRVPHLLAEVGSPVAALGQWLDVFVDFLTKHGLAAALRSDSAGFYGLHAYFLDRLVPVCEQLLDAAENAGGEIENAGGEIRYARVSTSGRWVFSDSRSCSTATKDVIALSSSVASNRTTFRRSRGRRGAVCGRGGLRRCAVSRCRRRYRRAGRWHRRG